MSSKRSRASYEGDARAQQTPFVIFGTPLPPLDPDIRDDGSYVPVWKQEVRDERGRKRLHGAFTGGWSAGYFNTVGSKEGWAPSTFTSSRTNRRKDDPNATKLRPEDYMDEEDLADAEEAKKIQMSASFSALGSTESDAVRTAGLGGIFLAEGETMGVKLLKRMGWKEGQGIGPKVRRRARLDGGNGTEYDNRGGTHLFAPENVAIIAFNRKTDRKGLGFEGESSIVPRPMRHNSADGQLDGDGEDRDTGPLTGPRSSISLKLRLNEQNKKPKGGIGVGILNDTGSDDDDPYDMGPKISYNRVIGGDKKKKKTASAQAASNSIPKAKPPLQGKKTRLTLGLRQCHDGRPPLDGFVFGRETDSLTSAINAQGRYPPPTIPPGWVSKRQQKTDSTQAPYVSTADAARASQLDSKSRASLLGEKQLPGKSVFDFISATARQRLATATGRTDLPQGKGEVPEGYDLTEAERLAAVLRSVPKLDKDTAAAALARGAGPGAPYADDTDKRARYRSYLEYQAGFTEKIPTKPPFQNEEEWLRELHEFHNCARIFKPMTGYMASRFTTSSKASLLSTGSSGAAEDNGLVSKPVEKPKDPAEEAAALGLYGQLTRSVADFYPTRLLCKRFNIKPPAHIQPEQDMADASSKAGTAQSAGYPFGTAATGSGMLAIDARPFGSGASVEQLERPDQAQSGVPIKLEITEDDKNIDTTRNSALEGKRAGDEVFRAIFGDSDDDEG